MWKTVRRARESRRSLTTAVQGAYQELGPQGTMARVARPWALRASTRSASSRAMTPPISAESFTSRSGIFRAG